MPSKFIGEPGVEYVHVHGNSYPVRESLKQLRGRWNPEAKCWMVPKENQERANYLVHGDGGGRESSAGWDHEDEALPPWPTSLADSFSARHSVDVPPFLTDESIAKFGQGALGASPGGAVRLALNERFADVAEKHHGPMGLIDSYYDDEY